MGHVTNYLTTSLIQFVINFKLLKSGESTLLISIRDKGTAVEHILHHE